MHHHTGSLGLCKSYEVRWFITTFFSLISLSFCASWLFSPCQLGFQAFCPASCWDVCLAWPTEVWNAFVLDFLWVPLLCGNISSLILGLLVNMFFSEWILIQFLKYVFASFYVCVTDVHICTSTFSAHRSQKRALSLLELELRTHKKPCGHWETNLAPMIAFNCWPSLQRLNRILL